jgi:transposase
MNQREELLVAAQRDLVAFVEERLNLETQLTQTIAEQTATITEQNSLIEQLKRMLFGPKSEQLTDEQAEQLAAVASDLQAQAERPAPDSDEVLQAEDDEPPKKKKKRGGRHPLPVHLEVQITVLEPAQANCEYCGQLGQEIGREQTEQIDLIPAKLIVRRTVRIKRCCQCGCGKIAIAPLPAQLIPSSKLGIGLAVFILLSKYDDHVALYTLERIFRERHGVEIPRQQMVQWIDHIAGLLRLIVDLMWAGMKQSDYLQIDETPVKVLDP